MLEKASHNSAIKWFSLLTGACLFLVGTEKSSGQDSTSFAHRIGLEYGVYFSPGASSITYFSDFSPQNVREASTPLYSYRVGTVLGFRIIPKFRTEIGIGYAKQGWIRDATDPFVQNSQLVRDDVVRIYESIEVPIKLIYRLGKGRIRFQGAVGVVIDTYVRSGTWTNTLTSDGVETWRGRSGPTTGIPANVSPFLSFGMDASLSELFGIRIEPFFQHNVVDWDNSTNHSLYLWSAGVGIVGYIRH